MRTVYGIGFLSDRFLMVYNPSRKGWEMPGGHIENDETDEEAVKREFLEESGFSFTPIAKKERGTVSVFAGTVEKTPFRGEMEWQFFKKLPLDLAFPEEEYEEMIAWGRRVCGSRTIRLI